MKLLQNHIEEKQDWQRRMNQLVEMQQSREQLTKKTHSYQEKMKTQFDKRAKAKSFMCGDMVVKWNAVKAEKGKHGKFGNLWIGPFKIKEVQDNNTFILEKWDGDEAGC